MEKREPISIKQPGNGANLREGFTLIEMLVSIAIFSLSMTVVFQLFSFSMKAQKVLTAHSQLVNEISYDMEHISRGIRMAKKDTEGTCISTPVFPNLNFERTTHFWDGKSDTHGIKFQTPNAAGGYDCVEYYMGYLDGYGNTAVLVEERASGASTFTLPLTSPDIELLNFNISGTGWSQDDDLQQPRVTLSLEMRGRERQSVAIQTTVSQRNPDVRN